MFFSSQDRSKISSFSLSPKSNVYLFTFLINYWFLLSFYSGSHVIDVVNSWVLFFFHYCQELHHLIFLKYSPVFNVFLSYNFVLLNNFFFQVFCVQGCCHWSKGWNYKLNSITLGSQVTVKEFKLRIKQKLLVIVTPCKNG